jgi:hypothetical protein
MEKMEWLITVSGYGSFIFEGTEKEAEERRSKKAIWENAIARKRLLDENEIKTGIVNHCMNHPNYNTKLVYNCYCERCTWIKEQKERKKKINKLKRQAKQLKNKKYENSKK